VPLAKAGEQGARECLSLPQLHASGQESASNLGKKLVFSGGSVDIEAPAASLNIFG